MKSLNNILILAAGRGLSMDGIHKLKLMIPFTDENILQRIERQFQGDINIVVGYRAAELISEWPKLNFIYNYKWYENGSAKSAGMGLEDLSNLDSILIMPSDIILSDTLADIINSTKENSIFLVNTENRTSSTVNVVTEDNKILNYYRGPKKDGKDLEAIGIVKLCNNKSIISVTDLCQRDSSKFFVEAVLDSEININPIELSLDYDEVNSAEDYYELWKKLK